MSPVVPDSPGLPGLPRPLGGATYKGVLATPHLVGGYARVALGFRSRGQPDFADRALRRAMMIEPGEPRLLVNAANLWLSSDVAGDPARALRRAICLDPNLSAAIERLLLIHKATGDLAGALRVAGWLAHASATSQVRGLLEWAALVAELGEQSRALRLLNEAFRETVRLKRNPEDLIRVASRIGGPDVRLDLLRRLLCVWPIDAIASEAIARSPDLHRMEGLDGALLGLCRAWPLNAIVQNAAGVARERRGQVSAALTRYKMASVLSPDISVAVFNVGVLARYAGNFNAARRFFQRSLAIAPRDPIYRYNLGHVLLATGQTSLGLPLYEERWRAGQRQSHRLAGQDASFSAPFLDANAAQDKKETILIWGEQGLGDEIWFAGFAPGLFSGCRTILECDPRLVDLFERSGLAETVIARTDPPHALTDGVDIQVAAGSLPFVANKRFGVPPPTPRGYLKVSPRRAERLRSRLANLGDGPTIGISWRSRKLVPDRSFEAPLDALRSLLALPHATFVNLQYDATDSEIAEIMDLHGVQLVGFADIDPLRDIDDLAALISVLDHVVTIANVNVAICHGIGRSSHVALRHYQEDWRFQRDRAYSPWLPDCRVYWPESSDEPKSAWYGVFNKIARTIRPFLG